MSGNPLEQFLVKPLIPLKMGGYDITFTNSSLFMVLTTAAALCFQYAAAPISIPYLLMFFNVVFIYGLLMQVK